MSKELIDSLTANHRQSMDAMNAEMATSRKQAEEFTAQLHQQEEEYLIREVVKASGDWCMKSAEDGAITLLRGQLRLVDGQLTATSEDGFPLVGENGILSPAELVSRFRKSHPEFVRQVHTATTAKEPAESDERLKKLFGPKSIGGLANRLAKDDLNEYRRLRQIAKERGITR